MENTLRTLEDGTIREFLKPSYTYGWGICELAGLAILTTLDKNGFTYALLGEHGTICYTTNRAHFLALMEKI